MNLTTPLTKLLLAFIAIPGWLTYTDSTNKFSMSYPKEWTPKASTNVVAFLSPKADSTDTFQDNVNLMLQDLSAQPMTLEQYLEATKKQITDYMGEGAILSQTAKTIAGQKAMGFVYNLNYQGRLLKIKQYCFIKDNKAWLFTFTAEPGQFTKYEQTANSIIDSFKFLP